jgi:hypothetical protein
MTSQEIFDTVVAHLLQQGKQSKSESDICLYRSDDGLKCAIGALIPDSDYVSDMEAAVVYPSYCSPSTTIQSWAQSNYPNDLKLLNRLQKLHDNGPSHSFNNPHDAWEEYILTQSQIIAEEFNLTWKRTP